jgi:hypothetical protein
MEEKKFDINSLIGFVLLGAIVLWWMYSNQPTPEAPSHCSWQILNQVLIVSGPNGDKVQISIRSQSHQRPTRLRAPADHVR